MKLSKLIKKLQAIEAETPFDSDVVTGDDFMPTQIKSVYHEPPYTFIQFAYEEPEEDQLAATSHILTFERMAQLSNLMTAEEQVELISWEKEFVTGDGAYGTSDWPGWEKVFARLNH